MAVTVAPVEDESVDVGVQVYVDAPEAVSATPAPPEHRDGADGVNSIDGRVLIVITALPVIALVHPPAVFVARTVYVPATVCKPKDIEDPVLPTTGIPTVVAPLYN